MCQLDFRIWKFDILPSRVSQNLKFDKFLRKWLLVNPNEFSQEYGPYQAVAAGLEYPGKMLFRF